MNAKAQSVRQLHDEAMEYTDRSFIARRLKNHEEYLRYTKLAFEKEAAAADLMVDEEDIEPTRSVLHRSAATLAWRCEMHEEARRLIYRALAGNPPPGIEWELNDLLGKVDQALAKGANHFKATDQTISKVGVLKTARANATSECELLTDDRSKWTIEVPDDMMNEILGAYFNKRVQVEGKRMRKNRLLQRIRLERIEQIRAI